MDDFLYVLKALADKNRLRALLALKDRELCVCHIIELLGLAPSTVSKHMAILLQVHLVEGRKDGRWMYYFLPKKNVRMEIQEALSWIFQALSKKSEIKEDSKRLKKILKTFATQISCKNN